jgi:hypothetical protein
MALRVILFEQAQRLEEVGAAFSLAECVTHPDVPGIERCCGPSSSRLRSHGVQQTAT